jgi:hypothetical protein
MDFVCGFASRVPEGGWTGGWTNGYLYQLILSSAHAIQCANLQVPYGISICLCFTGLHYALRALASSVNGAWTDHGGPREFDPIGHILASTLDLLRGWASRFFCESHRLYIEEAKRWSREKYHILIGRGDTWFQDGSQKLVAMSQHRRPSISSSPVCLRAEPTLFFLFFSFCNSLTSPRRRAVHAHPLMWYDCGFNYRSGNTCLTLWCARDPNDTNPSSQTEPIG